MEMLRHRAYKLLVSMLILWVLASCSNDANVMTTDHGFVSVSANVDGRFSMDDGSVHMLDASMMPMPNQMAMSMNSGDIYSHKWAALADFDADQSFMTGPYHIELTHEGVNGGPSFSGEADFQLSAGEHKDCVIDCRPSQSLVELTAGGQSGNIVLSTVSVHSVNSTYEQAVADNATHILFVDTGQQRYYAELLRTSDNRTLTVGLPLTTTLQRACGTEVAVKLENGELTMTAAGKTETMAVDDALFGAAAPTVNAVGFTPDQEISVDEGITLKQPIMMDVASGRKLAHVYLTLISPILNEIGAPGEFDLLTLTAEDREYLNDNGLVFQEGADGKSMNVDFTRVLESMASFSTAQSEFLLVAEDVAGVCSEPMALKVSTRSLEFTLHEITPAVIGEDVATMLIVSNMPDVEREDFAIVYLDAEGKVAGTCPIVDWTESGEHTVSVSFKLPAGDQPVDIAVEYLGLRRVQAQVLRKSPEFEIEVDAYATTVIMHVKAATEDQAKAVTEYGKFTVNGQRASVWFRDPDTRSVILNGLQPQTRYTLSTTVGDGTPVTNSFVTETALQIPDADWDQWKVLIDAKHLAQGGRYSATSLSVVNRQNFTDVYVQWPKKHWASVNAKTFYAGSRNQNTWYMQPTTAIEEGPLGGDAKAMRLTSAAWDHDGEAIPDYIQQAGQSLPYNNNIPTVSHRSAGRLWLGSYEYDAVKNTETIVDSEPFTSRPSALNGYFKYLPDLTDNNDRGYAYVAILNNQNGEEIVIAEGKFEFTTSPDYKAFSIPLTYKYFNLPATHLRLMFASSNRIGDQAEEDLNVPVTAKPETAQMTGSTLWVYGLTFSY